MRLFEIASAYRYDYEQKAAPGRYVMEEVLPAKGANHPALSQKTPGLERLAALSGAASVVLWITGSALVERGGKGLSPDQSIAAVGAGFAEYADEARVGSALLIAAVALSLVFLGPLWSRLHGAAPPLAAVAVAGLRHHIFPPWFSWLSLAFAVVLLVGLLPVGPAGLLGVTGGLWVVVASLLLAADR